MELDGGFMGFDLLLCFLMDISDPSKKKKKNCFQNPIKHENIRLDIHLLHEDEAHGGVR